MTKTPTHVPAEPSKGQLLIDKRPTKESLPNTAPDSGKPILREIKPKRTKKRGR